MADYIDSLLENVTNGVEGVYAKELGDKIKQGLTGKMEDRELDELAAETAIAMCTKHYNYNIVATKIVIDRLYSIVQTSFSESMELLEELDVLHPEFITFVRKNRIALDLYIKSERDFELDYFGFKTLEKSYLQRKKGVIVETPQYLFMRVACAIHRPNLENVFNVYDDLSKKYYIHATPTLFNAGMKFQQLSSCYLVAMQDDSITGIYDTLKECAQISKWAGGIGVHIHQIRGKNSKIKSNNGTSDGIVPMLRVFNDTARYCNQAGKRPGSFAVYLEPWHSDVEAFLDLKKNHGNEEERARDLFYALWIPDLFMKQVGSNGDWYLMTPNDSVGLSDVYGKEFEDLYWKYVEENKYTKKMKARELWTRILYSQIETGVPYMLYKDACNQKSNQKNLGTIKSSNLCTEVVQYSDKNETAVCNLASIGLPMYVTREKNFNHELLGEKVRQIVRNLNRVIDINFYPTENSHRSNMRHRPIGIGVQGLADVFMELGLDWESEPARKLNRDIFETIYYYSISESCELAKVEKPYQSYQGSPISEGKFQFDLWKNLGIGHSGLYDWESLRKKVLQHGVRNSLMVAPMPTASTSQILGFNECITGDTLVTLPNGICKRLDKFTNIEETINSYDDTTKGIHQEKQYEFLEKGEKDIHVITLVDGRKIKCTKNHKILTKNDGWKQAEKINKDDILIISPVGTEDIKYDDENDWKLELKHYTFTLQNEIERTKTLAFSRILGYIRTDGSIQTTGKVTAVFGTEQDAKDFINDCLLIINDITKYKSRTTSSNCIEVCITGTLSLIIKSIDGIPHGTRVSQECDWPVFITSDKCPRSVLREFMAGLFGGDGHSPCLIKAVNTYTFSRISFSQSCCPKNKDYLINTMNVLCKLLSRLDIHNSMITNIRNFKSINHDTYRCGDTEHVSVKISLPASSSTFNTFMSNIGIRYCSHKLYRFEIAASWSRYMNLILYQYNTILKNAYIKTNMYTGKGRHTRALAESITEFEMNECLLNTYYSKPSITLYYDYIRRTCKINQQFEYESLKLKHITNAKEFIELTNTSHMFNNISNKKTVTYATNPNCDLPVFELKVIDNRKSHKKEFVYDINVKNTHTFIANGIVVHNCIEPITSNIYSRRTLAGSFMLVNKRLMQDCMKLGIWSEALKNEIITNDGSIQEIETIPKSLRDIYKTVWDIKQKVLINLACDRGRYICQSQSLNLYLSKIDMNTLGSMHLYGWIQGLKTGLYYLRIKPVAKTQQFTVEPTSVNVAKVEQKEQKEQKEEKEIVCRREAGCTTCSA